MQSQTEIARQHLFVNCWHLGELESEAMWRIYCPEGTGVATVVPYARLCESISRPDTYIGSVSYIRYESDQIAELDVMHGFALAMHKRKEFAHETEARIVAEMSSADSPNQQNPDSIKIPWVAEDHLIKVVISPYSSSWYADTVLAVVKRLSPTLSERVCLSSMCVPPASPATSSY